MSEAPKKKQRAGKKTRRKGELWQATLEGTHQPTQRSTVPPPSFAFSSCGPTHSESSNLCENEGETPAEREAPNAKEAGFGNVPNEISLALKLSEPVGSQGFRPSREPYTQTSKPVPGPRAEIRLSVDFHGVLDLGVSGFICENQIAPENRNLLVDHINQFGHLIGVCSYIGDKGPKSAQRRAALKEQIRQLNTEFGTEVKLCITSDPEKSVLNPDSVHVHIDDKISVAYRCKERGLDCVLVRARNHPEFPTCRNFQEALYWVQRRCYIARTFKQEWPAIFDTSF